MSSMYFMGPPSLLPDSRTGAAEIDRPPRDSPAPFPSRSPTHDRVGGRDVVGRRRPEATMTNPGDDIYGSAEHQAFRDTVRRFVQTELVPRAREFAELGRIGKSLYGKMGAHGLLNGSKIYITNATTADWLCLLAVTDPAAGYGGFTQIVVPTDARGFSYQLLDKIGNLGSDTGLLFFDDVRVPVSNTIGDPNRGFQQQMNQFQDERMVPVVMGPVTARQLWEITLRHCQPRVAFGKPLAKMQVNQHKFVDMMIQITAAQEFAHRCIRKMVRGEDATLDISMAKVFTTAVQQYVATTCVQLFGGAGYCWENPAARAFVDSRLVSIVGAAAAA